jgi:hypothetical protein
MPAEERDGFTRDIPTGQTYRQHWAELDTEGRGAFLRHNGVKLYASRDMASIGAAVAEQADAPTDTAADAVSIMGRVPRFSIVEARNAWIGIKFGALSKLIDAAKAA